jgi:purine-binding chemotaxis protein CheW
MTKQLFANEKVMKHYLDALLQEESSETLVSPVENLLSDVESKAAEHQKAIFKPKESQQIASTIEQVESREVVEAVEVALPPLRTQDDSFAADEFQALYFEVAGLTLAVPLKSLGGIYQLGEINQLFGKPDWFKGVMLHREEKLNVVDSARWVMPEKYNKNLEEALNYQYLIMLGESNWGLLAERLIDNVSLSHQDIKWRDKAGRRPWLAGLIKEKMCALINVSAMTELLNQGLDSQDD